MITTEQTQRLLTGGGNVVGNNGEKIGGIGQVFLDDHSGQPEWVTAKTGLFGGGESFVPLRDAEVAGEDIRVPYGKDKVKDAPRISDADSHLSEDEEATLYEYYGYGYDRDDTTVDADRSSYDTGHDTSGANTDSAMTRSEEQVQVGTQREARGKARLRKYVVTENVTQTVPVTREEVRVEREPITEANRDAAHDGPAISEEEHEMTLNEERVVVQKEAVPVERVRLEKDTVTEQQQVDEEVRKEQIEVDDESGTLSESSRGDARG
jgi:uncharacterized protein (TIGR02271 family)